MMPRGAMMLSPKDPRLPFQVEQEKWIIFYMQGGLESIELPQKPMENNNNDDGLFNPPDDRDYP